MTDAQLAFAKAANEMIGYVRWRKARASLPKLACMNSNV
ncbi:hypothetical protein CDS [Bradyrhizobium sp.]|nr:hypothetical protein CDS [Bradyrhizobium sp.]